MPNKLKTSSFANLPAGKAGASAGKQKSKFVFYLLLICLTFFLSLNIVFSQNISPIYFRIINDDRSAVVNFLQTIRYSHSFSFFYNLNKNIYGKNLQYEVFAEENKKVQLVKNLEQILTRSPRARDVVYMLYVLNKDLNHQRQANEYLKTAKAIDPNIKE